MRSISELLSSASGEVSSTWKAPCGSRSSPRASLRSSARTDRGAVSRSNESAGATSGRGRSARYDGARSRPAGQGRAREESGVLSTRQSSRDHGTRHRRDQHLRDARDPAPAVVVVQRQRVGIVGAGGIAAEHLQVLTARTDVEVLGIVDRSAATARWAAQRWQVAEWFTDHHAVAGGAARRRPRPHAAPDPRRHRARRPRSRGPRRRREAAGRRRRAELLELHELAETVDRWLLEDQNYRWNDGVLWLSHVVDERAPRRGPRRRGGDGARHPGGRRVRRPPPAVARAPAPRRRAPRLPAPPGVPRAALRAGPRARRPGPGDVVEPRWRRRPLACRRPRRNDRGRSGQPPAAVLLADATGPVRDHGAGHRGRRHRRPVPALRAPPRRPRRRRTAHAAGEPGGQRRRL